MKKQITKYLLVSFILLFALLSWFSVDRAINVPGSSTWLIPILCFSFFFSVLSLGIIIIKEKLLLNSVLAVSFSFSLIFAFSFGHLIIIFLSYLLAILSVEKISKDLNMNIKLNIPRSIRAGRTLFILAFAFSITSQYTSEVMGSEKANTLPKMDLSPTISRVIPIIYPNLKNSNGDSLTVDNFILELSKKKSTGFMENILNSPELEGRSAPINESQMNQIILNNQEEILQEGRVSLGNLSGKELTGQEKMTDVFSEMINNQINKYFSPNLEKSDFPIVTLFISFILVLTILSLGPFLVTIVGYMTIFIFWIFKKTNLVKISKVIVEMEVVEL